MGLGLEMPLLDLVCIGRWLVDKEWEEGKSGTGTDEEIGKDETNEGKVSDGISETKGTEEGKWSEEITGWDSREGIRDCEIMVGVDTCGRRLKGRIRTQDRWEISRMKEQLIGEPREIGG